METRFYLGKIDFANTGRNRNKVFVTFSDGADLCPKGDEHLMLSFEIKMANNHGNECSNQCQGVLAKYPEVADTLLFKLAMNLTKKYGAKPFKLWDRREREMALALCNGFPNKPIIKEGV